MSFTQEQMDEALAKQATEINAAHGEEMEGLKKSKADLLAEKKAEQAKANESEDLRKQQEEFALKEKGEFEKLYGASNEELKNLKAQVAADKDKTDKNTIKSFAAKLAGDLSGGLGAEAIADATDILSRSVSLNDSGEPVFTVGGIQVDSDTMKKQFSESRPYLVAGSMASGGGATQTKSAGGAGQTKWAQKVPALQDLPVK